METPALIPRPERTLTDRRRGHDTPGIFGVTDLEMRPGMTLELEPVACLGACRVKHRRRIVW